MKKEITLSTTKAIVFGFIINIIISGVISTKAFDIINAFQEEPLQTSRGNIAILVFPYIFVILASVLISYTMLSLKSKKKED